MALDFIGFEEEEDDFVCDETLDVVEPKNFELLEVFKLEELVDVDLLPEGRRTDEDALPEVFVETVEGLEEYMSVDFELDDRLVVFARLFDVEVFEEEEERVERFEKGIDVITADIDVTLFRDEDVLVRIVVGGMMIERHENPLDTREDGYRET